MKYYYLAADGSTAGPETLESLTALMAGGTVTVATMVVPMGGEDWTPLARVLRFFYVDDAGATIGPVAFSELNRLNQIAALASDAWVLVEGGTEWTALAGVLEGGGVAPAAPPAPVTQLHRTATGAYRPPAGNPYAAPSTATGKTGVVRRRATGGLRRGPFFGVLLFLVILLVGSYLVSKRAGLKALESATDFTQVFEIVRRHFLVTIVAGLVALLAGLVVIGLRIKNIGWSLLCVGFFVLPVALLVVMNYVDFVAWLAGLWLISCGVSLILFIPVGALPPGYNRHRRMDSAGWLITMCILLVYGGIFAWGYQSQKEYEKELERRREKIKEHTEQDKADKAAPTAAAIQHTGIDRGKAMG
jgi:hypothetical protein